MCKDLPTKSCRRKCEWCGWIFRLDTTGAFVYHGFPMTDGTTKICPGSGRKPR